MLTDLTFKTNYVTGEEDLVKSFYAPSLDNSVLYWRAAGYFRSSVYLLVDQNILNFSKRGGKVRLVCSPELTPEDIEAINTGYKDRDDVISESIDAVLNDLLALDENAFRINVLSTLIAHKCLDLRLAYRPNAAGIFHQKIGVFTDDNGDSVSFVGSVNETWSGWNNQGNHESIEAFCSWKNTSDAQRVRNHVAYFDRLWGAQVPNLAVVEFPEAQRLRLISYACDSLEEISSKRRTSETTQQMDGLTEDDSGTQVDYRPPELFPHQLNAIMAWKESGCRGILEHATGSGKTITALAAMEEHLSQGLPVLVLVPSTLLLKQWRKEVSKYYPSNLVVLLAGGGNVRWRQAGFLRSMTGKASINEKRMTIATMQTASSEEFRSLVKGGDHLMIVADEVHQTGSPEASRIFNLESGKRLGLSATPRRYGDIEGTLKIFNYFGDVIPPPFTLGDAISCGRLVPYEYFPIAIDFTQPEKEAWRSLSREISKIVAILENKKDSEYDRRLKMLLIKRARIAKKAVAKVTAVAKILKENFRRDDRWLIYCEDREQLSEIKVYLRDINLHALEYHSEIDGDGESVLRAFEDFGGILLSIRCLDEGVDMPSIDRAIIVASSQNPRQFIQRRGRVLRQSKQTGKQMAKIFDILVVPECLEETPEQTSLLELEIARALEFSRSAANTSAAARLREFAINSGLDMNTLLEGGEELEVKDE